MPKLCLNCGFTNEDTELRREVQCPLCRCSYDEFEASLADEAAVAGLSIEDYAATLRQERSLRASRVGFVAGTVVHTRRGLCRIDSLGPGDFVLTQPSTEGNAPVYAPVLRVHQTEQADIVCAGYMDQPSLRPGTRLFQLFATGAQLFWVQDVGWTPASRLEGDWLGPSPLPSLNQPLMYSCPDGVYETDDPDIGWVGSSSLEGSGYTWNFRTEAFWRCEEFDTHKWPQDLDQRFPGIAYSAAVYSVELEGYESYFVGEHGLRVSHHEVQRGA